MGLSNEYGATDAFMAIELRPGGIPAGGGLVRYGPEFAAFAITIARKRRTSRYRR